MFFAIISHKIIVFCCDAGFLQYNFIMYSFSLKKQHYLGVNSLKESKGFFSLSTKALKNYFDSFFKLL